MSPLCNITSLDFQAIDRVRNRTARAGTATQGGPTLAEFGSVHPGSVPFIRTKNRADSRSGPVAQFCIKRATRRCMITKS